jgi:hypothetical protein
MHAQSPDARTAARQRELLVLAMILAAVLWGLTLFDASGDGRRGRLSGLPIGTDFVAFYTYAKIGLTGQFQDLTSFASFFAAQVALVPVSIDTPHPPLYPPQLALLLSPLALLTYGWALLAMSTITISGYVWIARRIAAGCPHIAQWPWHVAAISLGSPALWLLVLHGQISLLALVALYAAWEALRRGRNYAGGIALGLLAYKVSLFAPILALCVLAREWRIVGGALAAAVCQFAFALPWVGLSGLTTYVTSIQAVATQPDLIAAKPILMHSLRTFWTALLPSALAVAAYVASALGVLVVAAAAWRRSSQSPLNRIGLASIVSVLVSPHLYVYDLVVLAPFIIASAETALAGRTRSLRLWSTSGYLAPLWSIPFAAAGLHASTIVFVMWLVVFCRETAPADRQPMA